MTRCSANETNCFVARNWQLAYAEALLEDALPFLPISIVLAERAILNRYLELHDQSPTAGRKARTSGVP